MRRYILLLGFTLAAMGLYAQVQVDTTAFTINLKNDSSVTYRLSDLDSVRRVGGSFGEAGGIGLKIYVAGAASSADYLYSQIRSIDFVTDTVAPRPADGNVNRNGLLAQHTQFSRWWDLEIPRMNQDDSNTWVTKSTSAYGITYRLEWSNSKIANRWTCYQLHAGNKLSNVKRQDAFAEDPDIPAAYRSRLSDYSGSGFSRGHLCPSADRLCSREQNSQTFYLSNMQPQYQAHNGGLWARLESQVRDWADYCDTLYVVKAATISDVTLNGVTSSGLLSVKCKNRLPVAKYFYMALLAYNKSTNTYHALGLWTLHQNANDDNTHYADYAITIDELERRTGIDFFCNLPDDIEAQVESTLNLTYWNL